MSLAMEMQPGRFFKIAGPLLEKAAKRQVRKDLQTLKDMLEARG